jgi:hypothetical protein
MGGRKVIPRALTSSFASSGSGGGGSSYEKGFFADESALVAAYPTGVAGDWAIVGSTDTIWVWDSDSNAWVNSKYSPTHAKGWFTDPASLMSAIPSGVAGDWAIIGSTDTVWVWDTDTNAWVDTGQGSIVNWGDVGGLIANQTDLQNVLDSKLNTSSGVITVDALSGQYGTIQSGIDAAIAGQVVEVMPGEYVEDITLKSGVTLKGFCALTTKILGKVTYTGSGTTSISYIRILATNKECMNMSGSGILNVIKCALLSTWTTGLGQTASTAKSVIKQSSGSIYARNQSILAITSSGDNVDEHNTAIYWLTGSSKLYLESFGARHTVINTVDTKQNLEISFCNNSNSESEIKIKDGFCNIDGVRNSSNYVAPFYMFYSKVAAMITGNLILIKNSGHGYCAFSYKTTSDVLFTHNTIIPIDIDDIYLALTMDGTGIIDACLNYFHSVTEPQVGGNVNFTVSTSGHLISNGIVKITGTNGVLNFKGQTINALSTGFSDNNALVTKGYVDEQAADKVNSYSSVIITEETTIDGTYSTYVSNSSSTLTHTLRSVTGITGRRYTVANLGSGTVTLACSGSELINTSSTVSLAEGESITVEAISSGWVKI